MQNNTKLYIDESGNTGQPLWKKGNFNFTEQPFYALTGLLMNDNKKKLLEKFIQEGIIKYQIQGDELKSKYIYNSKSEFLEELIDHIIDNKIPFFVELMDKKFFIHTQIIEYFIVPYYALEINNSNLEKKRIAASTLGQFLNDNIYNSFIETLQENSNDALEKFYDILINHFQASNELAIKKNVEQTKEDYFELKQSEGDNEALERFSPIPDQNSNKNLIHILPNYSAFTNLIARANKFTENKTIEKFSIIHDEQKQFDIIFEESLKSLKKLEIDDLVAGTYVSENSKYAIDKHTKLDFVDSKSDLSIQAADLIAGFIMRFWIDFQNDNSTKVNKYLPLLRKLNYPIRGESIGINYVVPVTDHQKILDHILQ